ncbi:hypothetical protein E4M02_11050 [Brevundimonas sp. S30B]|uniref:hypothetical protein n=1 Tax=unclassified Brevundimonas TaxID=2622653 RepID=UPI001071DEEE|nr:MULTISPECIES: hypothetical protein [unclassified Brevundimonas]QBX38651.1 hypothetical protein E4M01_13310 [Brevundimonas sp. MF30-B]TFW01242.1 hypothetical protein E4M02_11050 [Brevundimonas sp. S30B]
MFGLRILAARRRVSKAMKAYRLAYLEWNQANARQDTRRMKAAGNALRAANIELLSAETALAALEAPQHGQVAR